MTKHVNADSILRGNFCDIVNFFRGRDIDDVDRLAQRALSVIFRTDHLVQTGNEVDASPFCANMFASSALESINCTLTTYPFVRESAQSPEADEDAVFDAAETLIEMAEGLSPDPAEGLWLEPAERHSLEPAEHRSLEPAEHRSLDPAMQHFFDETAQPDGERFQLIYELGSSRRLLFLTDGFKNDEAGYERAMAASPWTPPED